MTSKKKEKCVAEPRQPVNPLHEGWTAWEIAPTGNTFCSRSIGELIWDCAIYRRPAFLSDRTVLVMGLSRSHVTDHGHTIGGVIIERTYAPGSSMDDARHALIEDAIRLGLDKAPMLRLS